ncbi:hypothetical protein FRB93_010867 [Tulasnella sp. JGI-2019a]|nr:hypothetical protein FRB93_010867 [Tulasnella sp. JGI-2019a]
MTPSKTFSPVRITSRVTLEDLDNGVPSGFVGGAVGNSVLMEAGHAQVSQRLDQITLSGGDGIEAIPVIARANEHGGCCRDCGLNPKTRLWGRIQVKERIRSEGEQFQLPRPSSRGSNMPYAANFHYCDTVEETPFDYTQLAQAKAAAKEERIVRRHWAGPKNLSEFQGVNGREEEVL